MTVPLPVADYKYWAFLSYSHKDNLATRGEGGGDHIRWANWLHEQLETYRIPDGYGDRATRSGEPMPKRFFPAFRDEAELPTSHDLGGQIREALDRSRFLIVIASPRSACSRYVNEEVRYFRQLRRDDSILTLIVDGEPNVRLTPKPGWTADDECFCPALVHPLRPDGSVDDTTLLREEPIAADVRVRDGEPPREMRASERDQPTRRALRDFMKLKLIAGLMGVGLDELVQRDKIRQIDVARQRGKVLRRWLALVGCVSVAAVVAAVIAYRNGIEASTQRDVAEARRKSTEQALAAANAAASGLVGELVTNTKTWPGLNSTFKVRLLIRAQNVLLMALAAGDPKGSESNLEIRRSLGVVYSELGSAKIDSGNFKQGVEMLDAAADMFTKLCDEKPGDREYLSDLAIVLKKKGDLLLRQDEIGSAISIFKESLRRAMTLADNYSETANLLARLGIASNRSGDSKAAAEYFIQANKLLLANVSNSSQISDLKALSASYVNLCSTLDYEKDSSEVLRNLDHADELHQRIVVQSRDGTADLELMELSATGASIRGDVYRATKQLDKEIAARNESAARAKRWLEASSDSFAAAARLADELLRLGLLQHERGPKAEAERSLKTTVLIRRRLVELTDGGREQTLLLALSLSELGGLSKSKEAVAEAISLLEALVTNGKFGRAEADELIGEIKLRVK